jgi:thiamine biosynthesis lipoprotein
MGTLCTGVIESPDTARAARVLSFVFDEVARLEQVMTSWRDDSELALLNKAGSSMWFRCSPALWAVIDSSLELAKLTKGAFDPTIEPYNRAWNARGKGRVPKSEELQRAQMLVGWHKLSLDRDARRVLFPFSDMGIDLGGIGKGFALDHARRLLARDSVRAAMLNLGGEVLAFGEGWPVNIAHPADRLQPALSIVVSNVAISTSGQSERGIMVQKKRYGHIFDPTSGQPVPENATVTVIAKSATRADALSTALIVMGREDAAIFAERHPELGVLWLEPAEGAVRAWKWNFPDAQPAPGINLEWMN